MDGNSHSLPSTPPLEERAVPARSLAAMALALGCGGLALIYPPAAMLALAALTARVLLGAARFQFDPVSVIAPLAAAAAAGILVGPPAAVGMVFVWRLWADAHWSVQEFKKRAIASGRLDEARGHALAHAWLTPVYGLTLVAYTSPHMVAGLPLDLPHVPFWVPLIAGGLAAGALFDQALRRAADLRLAQLAPATTAHVLAHHTMFLAAFGLMLDVSAGIVALAAWRLAHAAFASRLRPV